MSNGGIDLGIPGFTDAVAVGSGGNATVYRANQPDLARTVAIKVIRNEVDDDVRRRFDRERKTMGRLSEHPGIVTIFDSGFTPHALPYLVMPFLGDGSMQDHLEANGPFEWRTAVRLMAEVSDTVHYAHQQGVIHRDIKPGNILLGSMGQPLVSDFGIARFTETTGVQSTKLTLTPAFSSPEALDGAEPSVQSDVYSLAATLFALINGTPAFVTEETDGSLVALIRNITSEPVPDLRERAPDPVCRIIESAMAKRPEDRPASAERFADLLRGTIGPPITGPVAATAPEPPPPPGPARKSLIALLVVGSVALAAALIFVLTRDDETGVAIDPTPAEEPTASGEPTPTEDPTPTEEATTPPDEVRPVAWERTELLEVPETPNRPDIGGGFLWVSGRDGDALAQIDLETLEVVTTIPTGEEPLGPVFVDGAVWVVGRASNVLQRIEPSTMEITDEFPVGTGSRLPTAGFGAVWVASRDGTLTRVETASLEATTVVLDGQPQPAVPGPDSMWVATSDTALLYEIDSAAAEIIEQYDIGNDALRPAVSDEAVWVSNSDDASVARLDLDTREVRFTDVGFDPRIPLVAGDYIWIPELIEDRVTRLDPGSGTKFDSVLVGDAPRLPNATRFEVWVPNRDGGSVTVLDLETAAKLATLSTGSRPETPAIDPDGDRVFVPNSGEASVSVFTPVVE